MNDFKTKDLEACIQSNALLYPYYSEGNITIYHGKAEQILPFLDGADLLLTDPPYGIGEAAGKNKSRGHLAVSKDYGNAKWDDEPLPMWLIDMACSRAVWHIIWGGNYYPMPATSCVLVWDKNNGSNNFADCELAYTNLKCAVRQIKYTWNGMIQENMKNKEKRVHPTQKPLEVMKWAIAQAPDDCQTIIDPFMGSGTTLLAAKGMGCKAIGIEQEEKYCKVAMERLRQETLGI